KLVQLISATTGGPLKYTGKSMKEVHKGMGITNEEFDALGADLKKALEKNDVKEEDIEALLKIVDSTRKDIVEGEKKDDAKDDAKKDDDKKDDAKKEDAKKGGKKDNLEGTWAMVAMEVGGKKMDAKDVEESKVTVIFKGDMMTVKAKDDVFSEDKF